MNVYSGQTIIITRGVLDGGINDVLEWEVYRKKVGEAYALIDTYNLVTEGHYIPPDDEVEGSTGTYNFAYPTEIPVSDVDDQFQYKFVATIRPGLVIERETTVFTVIELTYQNQEVIMAGIIVTV